jgi:hypothetical protein
LVGIVVGYRGRFLSEINRTQVRAVPAKAGDNHEATELSLLRGARSGSEHLPFAIAEIGEIIEP